MKKIILLVFSFIVFSYVYSQKNMTLYNMRGIPQATYVNPSFVPGIKFYISIPMGMQNFYYGNDGITYKNLMTKNSEGKLVFNTDKVMSKIKDKNNLSFETQNEIFALGIKAAGFYFSGTVVNRFKLGFAYPKDFVQFMLEGNGKSFLGKRASFDGLAFNLNSYIEYGIGACRNIGDKLAVGGKIKLLSGGANFTTKDLKLGIYTDPNTYDLTIDGRGEINTAGINGLFADTTRKEAAKKMLSNGFKFRNTGVGLDLGASLNLNDFITLTASVIDMGSITWKDNTKSYKKEDFNFVFKGVDFNQFLSDSSKKVNEVLRDTLEGVFKTNESNSSYKTNIGAKYYFGAFFKIGKTSNLSLVFQDQKINKNYIPALTFGFNTLFENWLTFSFNYTLANKSWTDFGMGLSIKSVGPAQAFLITDNIVGLFSRNTQKTFNICFGLAISLKDKKIASKVIDAALPGDQSK